MKGLVILLALAGCKDNAATKPNHGAVLDRIEAKAKTAPNTTLPPACDEAKVRLEDAIKTDAALAQRLSKLCDHDIWIAIMAAQVEWGEAERKSRVDGKVDCGAGDLFTSASTKLPADDAEAMPLRERYAAYCKGP